MAPTSPGLDRPSDGLSAADDPAGRSSDHARDIPVSRIAVVRNPRSHRNRGASAEEGLDPALQIVTPRDKRELAEALAEFARRGIELLVVDGGDGTVRDVLTRGTPVFAGNWPMMVVLPKGKTNALAVDLGMPRKWPLADVLQAAGQARVAVRRPIVVDRPGEEGWQATGFIMGTGVFNAAIDAGQVAHRFGAFQGFAVGVTAAFGVLQALFGIGGSIWRALGDMRLGVGADHLEVPRSSHGAEGKRFACGLSSLEKFPLRLDPFRGAGAGIRYLLFDAPLRRALALVPLILFGLDRPFLQRLGVHRGAADELRLELGGNFILDGESFPPGSYRLRLGPELRFLVP